MEKLKIQNLRNSAKSKRQQHYAQQKAKEGGVRGGIITSGRSEAEGRRPSDLADLTELKIFSPTLDKSMPSPPPWNNRNGSRKKNLEPSNPSLKSPLNRNGFPKALPKGNRLGCISTGIAKIEAPTAHFNDNTRALGAWRQWERSDCT